MNEYTVLTRDDALRLKLKKYFTGIPCKKGHLSERYTGGKRCLACLQEDYENNKTEKLEYIKQYQSSFEYKLKKSEYDRQYREDNLERLRPIKRAWKKRNSGKVHANTVNRRLDLAQRIPRWANLKNIRKIYIQCSDLNKKSDIKYHVDHIVPLRGRTVSGLHVEENLRIIPAAENIRKHAKLLEDLCSPVNHI